MNTVTVKSYTEPPFSEKEILRYAGVREADEAIYSLLSSCINEARGALSYKVCYCETDVNSDDRKCDFGFFTAGSKSLAKNLKGCHKAIIFAATVGIGIDRLIAKYSRISPSRALMLQAIGAERIEALCDAFCYDIEKEKGTKLRPRFSAGYGDAPLDLQKDIFRILNAPKNIGISLGDSMLMSPTKSVTAFIGIEK